MVPTSPKEVTQLLLAWSKGDEAALEQLAPLVEGELRRIAKRYIRRERPGHLLQTSALINEAYLRLIDWKNAQWESRTHFFGVAAQLMRRVLVDEARARNYQKRGGDAVRVSLTEVDGDQKKRRAKSASLTALDDALKSLDIFDHRKCVIVELRYFGGLTVEETARVMKLSARTVIREWGLAQAWLYRELSGDEADGS
jgi:RNA polymerase sigma-70 factor, ECF subfamily